MAQDVEVLERYLMAQGQTPISSSRPYRTIWNSLGKPIIYLTVPRYRKGVRSEFDPGRTQREILENILGPLKSEVINVYVRAVKLSHSSTFLRSFRYFNKIHPCFPVLDEKTFLELWRREPQRVSSALLCDIYASALLFWDTSDSLRHHHRPDLAFAWNQAVAALQEDFMAPSMSTVHAALLDMIGRPVLGVTGNIVNAGRTSTLAASLGLHRDPTSWKVKPHEKNVRINLWWGVLIHDYWSVLNDC
jgi:hypothetical protein